MKSEINESTATAVAVRDEKFKQKVKLGIILGIEFVAVAVILLLIFLTGKKSYTVTFDLNGGTLVSGSLEQTVSQGKSATAPVVAKEGCYLHSWSASFKRVTHDMVIKAVWGWETSTGFNYSDSENSDYCTIEGAYNHLYGDVFVPAYHDEKKILGMADNVFKGVTGITNVYMLDGMLYIGANAFSGCTSLETVELPGTLREIGEGAFADCISLKSVTLPDDLEKIPTNMFKNCKSLEEIVIPASVKEIDQTAFIGCTSLKKITFLTEEITEIDEESGEFKVVGIKGIETLGDAVFANCSALTEVILPETIKNVAAHTFDNPDLTIYLPFKENKLPSGFAPGWKHESTKVEWDYEPPEEETENTKQR